MQIEIKKKTFENMQNRLDYKNPKTPKTQKPRLFETDHI